MADPQQVLARRVHDAIVASFGPDYGDADPLIRPSSFADFQSNAALPLGKRLGRPPREVAADLAARLDVADMGAVPEVSGPGFINLRLRDDWIAAQASLMLDDPRLGLEPAASPQTVVVEYSSPNIAKEMHVGHLRTTIVGDAIARVLEFAGHRVIRDNHVGDWGTQFGMEIEYLLDVGENSPQAALLRTDPNAFYQAARRKFDSDPEFADRARKRVVDLQGGDQGTLELWHEIVDLSLDYLHRIYARLGVTLTDADIRGESFYNDMLADTVAKLEEQGIAVYSDGALVAFPPGFTGREGRPLPLIIRKRDGGYNYATTDLATIRYRVDVLHCDRAIYVVGSDQALHFRMVFAVARLAGWIPEGAVFEHAQIGLVLGPDGNRLRTRSGDNVQLSDLLSEAVERARGILDEVDASARFDAAELDEVAEAVGIGAVKYADLSTARDSAYVFDWDRMISFRGNTGPYLQYATARIRSIFRRAGAVPVSGPVSGADPDVLGSRPAVTAAPERALALKLLGFGATLTAVGETAEPHRLCTYLFDVASLFTTFYEECPVLKAEPASVRAGRLALCALTLRVLTTGLGLLGVPVPERM
jgi:arginyl-tRNA synthetase